MCFSDMPYLQMYATDKEPLYQNVHSSFSIMKSAKLAYKLSVSFVFFYFYIDCLCRQIVLKDNCKISFFP